MKIIQNRYGIMLMCAVIACVVPGCIKYHKTLPTEFPQPEKQVRHDDVALKYMRSTRVYEQFCTKALFDVLWLSDDVRVAYGNFHCKKRGVVDDAAEAFIARAREENNHWTTFCVLADVRDRSGLSLSDAHAPWTFSMNYQDKSYAPLSVKEVDLEPEYQSFFGSQRVMFKTAYMVKFPPLPADGPLQGVITLTVQSIQEKMSMVWDLQALEDAGAQGKRYEDFYWG